MVGALGALAALWLGVPAPFLTGPSLAVTLAALAGMPAHIPVRLRDAVFLLIGINMGSAVTPEAVETAARWPGSMVALGVTIVAIMAAGGALMQRVFGMDRMSGLLTATPGHLSFILSISETENANTRRIVLVQSLRVLLLTLAVPAMAPLLQEGDLPALPAMPHIMPLGVLAVVVVLSFVVGLGFDRARLPAPLLLGGMAVSGLSHAVGWVDGASPAWITIPAFAAMGTLIGTRFTGVTPREIAQSLLSAICLTGLAALIVLVVSAAVAYAIGLPMVTVLIAFAPGGLETMMAMSVLLDANPAYVAAHHVFRLVFLTVVIPMAVMRVRRKDAP